MPVESSNLCAFVPFPVSMAAVCVVVCVFILNFSRAQNGDAPRSILPLAYTVDLSIEYALMSTIWMVTFAHTREEISA